MTIEEKINLIQNSDRLDNIPIQCLPSVHLNEYFFVSYSHKDYKMVYADILRLQQCGMNIWYDRGMEAGKSWFDIAENHIDKYSCLGVIFYLSANSLLSESIHKEIELAKHYGKSLCTVNIPLEKEIPASAKQMLEKLQTRGMDIGDDKYRYISENLSDDIIYIDYSTTAERKAELISNAMQRRQLLTFSHPEEYDDSFNVMWLNDTDAPSIAHDDFVLKTDKGNLLPTGIDSAAFANSRKLRSVFLPKRIAKIGPYAFYNCFNLHSIILSDMLCIIGEGAFEYCSSLKNAMIPDSWAGMHEDEVYIGKRAFHACTKLQQVFVPDTYMSIDDEAFSYCEKLTEIHLPLNLSHLGKSAFEYCKSLTHIEMPEGLSAIEESTFYLCTRLEQITLPLNLRKIEFCAFNGCFNLRQVVIPNSIEYIGEHAFNQYDERASDKGYIETIFYQGNQEEWNTITIETNNNGINCAHIYFYSADKPQCEGMFWHYIDGKPVVWEENRNALYQQFLENKSNIESLDITMLVLLLSQKYQFLSEKQTVKLIISAIADNCAYTLTAANGKTFRVIMEFFDVTPKIGDTLILYMPLLYEKCALSFSANLFDASGRMPNKFQKEAGDVAILSTQTSNVILKRLFG